MGETRFWQTAGRGILDLVYPPLCILCREPVSEPASLCPTCWGELQFIEGDPDDLVCCSGYECGCHGETVEQAREAERERYARIPAIVFGPIIESRPVGEWETA